MAAGAGSWMVDIKNRLNGPAEPELWEKHSIYRVPRLLKDQNRKAYKPQVVSFGPYHNGDADVRAMEEHKQRALLHFLKRAKKPLDDFVSGMGVIVQQLQDFYQDLDQQRWNRDRFLQLMIVDGCFMLEVMMVAFGRVNDYSPNDPIFSDHGMLYNLPHIHRDMLMVENQLPLLVLSKLVAVESGNIEDEGEINSLVLKFVAPNETNPTPGGGLGLHPLDLYRQSRIQLVTVPSQSPPPREPSYFPKIIRSALELMARTWKPTAYSRHRSAQDGSRNSDSPGARFIQSVRELLFKVGICKPAADSQYPSPGIIRSARELDEAGIEFKKSETESLQDITFHDNVLSLPMIVVDDSTEYVFLNLMAFERLHAGVGNEVTYYVFFMDNIIDSAQDVSLLRSKGIIRNDVGSDKALANIFNTISKEVVGGFYPGSNLDEVNQKLNDYCQKKRNRWRANLIRTYFRSPWSFISLLAAIFLLALSFAQTLYTILTYYHS